MSPTNEVKWAAWKCKERGNCYVVPSRANPADPSDVYLDTFPDRETAKAYCDEINAGSKADEGLGQSSGGMGEIYPQSPPQAGGPSGPLSGFAGEQTPIAARPPAQTEGQTSGQGMTSRPTAVTDSDHWRGMLIDSIPQHIADRIDDAGSAYESLQSIINANIGLVLGRCRQGIAQCKQAISELATPIVTSTKSVRQLIVDTVTLEIQNRMGSAMTAFGTMQPAAPAYTPTGQSLNGPWVVWGTPYGQTPGKTCAYVADEAAGPTHTGDYILSWFADQAAAILYASNFNINSGCTPGPQPIPIPVPPTPPPPPIGSPPPPIPPTGPPSIGPDCCPIPTCPGFVKAPPNTYYAVENADGTHDNITLSAPPASIVWLPYGIYYQLPCYVPRNLETDPSGLDCLPIAGFDPCHPGRKVTGLWRPVNSIECILVENIPIRQIISEKRLGEIKGQIFFGEYWDNVSSAYVNDYVRYQVCPRNPIAKPVPGAPQPPVTPTTPTAPPAPPVQPTNPPSLPTIPPVTPVVAESEYCDNIVQVKAAFVKIGEYLLKGNIIDFEWIKVVDLVLANSEELYFDNFAVVVKNLIGHPYYKAMYENALSIVKQYKFADDNHAHLLACRSLFQWLDSLKSDAAYSTVGEASTEASAAPQIFGLGGGASWKSTWIGSMGIVSSIKFAIVPLLLTLDRCIAYSCPEGIPSIAEAIRLHLTNDIDIAHCECLVRFNGGVWPEYKRIINSQRARVDGLQGVQLWMRGKLTMAELRAKLRELGYIEEFEQDELIEVMKWVPGPSDLIRFMVRDVEDPNVVTAYQLDDEFPDKFVGLVEQQATAQGVDRDTMLRYWRAHWDFPSNTQLYEMLHRLRADNVPDNVNVSDWLVTEQDVLDTLAVNDVSPKWRERLVAISYRPLTRIDARRAFNVGKLDRAGLISNLRDQGYDLGNANILADFFEVLRLQSYRSNRWFKYYVNGGIDSGELRQYLGEEGADTALQDSVLVDAVKVTTAEAQQRCVKSYHARFLKGEWNDNLIVGVIVGAGVDLDQAETIAEGWKCERKARAKYLSAGSLCKYYERGLITSQEFIDRLIQVGYDANDAGLIIQECTIRIIERQNKAAAALAKQTAAAQEKIAKEREKIAKAIKAAKDKEEKAKQAIAKGQRRQQDQFTKAAARYARVAAIDTSDASNQMSAAAIHGHTAAGLPDDEAVELAIELAMAWKAKDSRSFSLAYDDMLTARGNAISAITAK